MTHLLYGRRFYVGRHGETDDNRHKIASGQHNNTYLTMKGYIAAKALRAVLEQLDITHATSSSLERAETTELIATYHLNLPHFPPNHAFDERDYEEGGKEKPNAEPYEAHQERVIEGINTLIADPECIPLIICHSGSIRRILDNLGNFEMSPDYINIPNGGVIEIVTPSSEMAQDWEVNIVTLGPDGLERKPMDLNAEKYRRRPDQPRGYTA